MADAAHRNNGDPPRVFVHWQSFLDHGIPASWQPAVQAAVVNACSCWMTTGGLDGQPTFWNVTDRLEPADGEIIVSMNERHLSTSRLASTFISARKASIVIHRKDGSTMSLWPWVPHDAQPGEIDLQAVLTHEFGHAFWPRNTGLALGGHPVLGDLFRWFGVRCGADR